MKASTSRLLTFKAIYSHEPLPHSYSISSAVFLPIVLFLPQLAEAYRNLQNTNRRHLNVHEPLIYDAVWLTAEVLNMSLPVLNESNLTLNSSQRSPALMSALNSALESNTYSGLTVRCCFGVLVLYNIIFST